MEHNLNKFSVLILAAGRSQRMGTPKMLLPFNNENNFLEIILKSYKAAGLSNIAVVVNKENSRLAAPFTVGNEATVVINEHPDWQRFYSVWVGLKTTNANNPVFIHNIDNPFVEGGLLKKMAEKLPDNGYVVPVYQQHGGHPVLLSGYVANKIIQSKDYSTNLKTFLSQFNRVNVETNNDDILVNINTSEEYRKFILNKELS